MTPEQQIRVVEEARKLIGVPFFHAGRTDRGLDCVGLLYLSAKNAGLGEFDIPPYSVNIDTDVLISGIERYLMRLHDVDPTEVGDVLLLRIMRAPIHLAMVSTIRGENPGYMIHAYQSMGKVVEIPYDITWQNRLQCRYRLET